MFARYDAPSFVPWGDDAIYNNPDISFTALQSTYLNWLKTVIESIGIFTRVEMRTDTTTSERLMPASKNDWYEVNDGPLMQYYIYYIDCYIEDNLFISFYSKTYKYKSTVNTREIDGVTYYQVIPYDINGFIVKPKNAEIPSYHAVYYRGTNTLDDATNNVLVYDGIYDPPIGAAAMYQYHISSQIVEIVRTDDALFFRFNGGGGSTYTIYTDYYSLCISKTFMGSIAVVTSYSKYKQVAKNGLSLFCISNDSENYAPIRSIPMNLTVEGASTVLSYIPVACSDDYLIGTYYTPLSQIQFEDRASSCFIRVAGNKYFYTGFFAAPYK